jgi:hypothetical protein
MLKLFYFFSLLLFLWQFNSLRINNKNEIKGKGSLHKEEDGEANREKNAEEKGKDSDKIPIINVHMEEPDRDPIEVKRYEEERRIERNRIRDLEAREEMDKRAFQQIISLQTSQLAKLTNIAESTSNILSQLAGASTGDTSNDAKKELDDLDCEDATKMRFAEKKEGKEGNAGDNPEDGPR